MFTILFNRAWEILDANRRAYIVMNILFYGVVIVFMIYAAFNQPLQATMLKTGSDNAIMGVIPMQGKSFSAQGILKTIGSLYLVNLLGTSFGTITFPSFVIPFAGILTGAEHAFEWGLLFSPANADIRPSLIMHSLTLVIEGQAYILAMLGAYVHGRAVIWPRTVGLTSHWHAFVEGVRQTGTLYMLIMVVLAIGAVYGLIEYFVMARLLF